MGQVAKNLMSKRELQNVVVIVAAVQSDISGTCLMRISNTMQEFSIKKPDSGERKKDVFFQEE